MLGVYASAAAILLASLVLGRALLHLLGRTQATWLAGAVGFAALTIAAPLLIRLPGRAATVAVLVGVAPGPRCITSGAPAEPGPERLPAPRWR